MSKSKLFSTARKEAGFTLIELLTVIVIIGILAAIAIPVFTSQRARAQDSQTISDVRNIAVQAETIMSDPTKTYDDVTKANIDFASSKNVSWNISGSAAIGGYCIVAKNTAGKKYTTDTTALTYDSLAGGVGQTGKACSGTNVPTPSGSTGVGSLVAVNAPAPTGVSANRGSQTSATVSWTIPTDTTITGYVLQRSATNNDSDFVTVNTVTSRTTSSFTDTSAPSTAAYYRLMSTTADGTSSAKSNVATLGAYVPSTTSNATSSGPYGTTQTFTVTDTGNYKIEAWGAKGGNYIPTGYQGGNGAYAAGTIALTAGQTLTILVGQMGTNEPTGGGAGGGGGTFVANGTGGSAIPLVVAGGGGGAGPSVTGAAGSTTNANTLASSGGNLSTTGQGSSGIGGSAGFYGNGNAQSWVGNGLAYSFTSSGYGSVATSSASGGYGGGSAGLVNCGGSCSGGGGGYTGSPSSGGGGSFVAANATGAEFNNTTKANSGAGKVVITRVS